MSRHASDRLARRLACHQALHDPAREPRNTVRWLPELRRWQSARLEAGFAQFLSNPKSAPAARFFLTDVYGDHDFSRRDADIARVLPMMRGLLPVALLDTVTNGIELSALTHAFDLRMADALQRVAPRRRKLDGALYAQVYREVGLPRLREHQIELLGRVGHGLADALAMSGMSTLLKISRGPAKAAGLADLQGFLERGFTAFAELGKAEYFIDHIDRTERELWERLFDGDEDPFWDSA